MIGQVIMQGKSFYNAFYWLPPGGASYFSTRPALHCFLKLSNANFKEKDYITIEKLKNCAFWCLKRFDFKRIYVKKFKSIIPSHNDVVGKSPSHAHAFLLVNKKAVFLYFNILFQFGFDSVEVIQGFLRFFKFRFKLSNAFFQFWDFFQKFAVWGVVASLNFWSLFSWLHFHI